MANGNGSEPSPLWYSVGALVLVIALMAGIVAIKPLDFSAVTTAHEGAPAEGKPEGVSHAAPAGEHAPEGTSHEDKPAPHE